MVLCSVLGGWERHHAVGPAQEEAAWSVPIGGRGDLQLLLRTGGSGTQGTPGLPPQDLV